MKINITCPSRYKINRSKIRETIKAYLKKKEVEMDDSSVINVVFVGKNKMRQLAARYKNEDEPLPVLTFPIQENVEGERVLGEIVICYPIAVLMAAQKEKTVDKIINFLLEHALNVLFKI